MLLMRRLQVTMSIVEGYSEHVMDAVGAELGPDYVKLRARVERNREHRGLLETLISRLLGLDLKMRQYTQGKAFCDEVAEHRGRAGGTGGDERRQGQVRDLLGEGLERPGQLGDRAGRQLAVEDQRVGLVGPHDLGVTADPLGRHGIEAEPRRDSAKCLAGYPHR